MSTGFLDYRTVRLHGLATTYLEAGKATAPAVVLLHDGGFGSDARSCWEPIIPLLAERYRVLAPDLLGHGRSPKVFHFDMDPMGQRLRHIAKFVDTLALEEPAFVGSSFGGGMVLQGAVRGVLAMRAGVSIAGPGGIFMLPEQFAKLQQYESSEDAARRVAELLLVGPSDEEVKRRFEASMAPGHWEALSAARLRNPARIAEPPDWRAAYRESLSRVETPILLVAGDNDPLLEEDWEQKMADLLPNGSSVEIAESRHQPHLDHPTEVAEVLLDFLDAHGRVDR